MTPDQAISALQQAAVYWAANYGRAAADVVRAACDALVAGVPGTELEILASVPLHNVDLELPEALPGALRELGLPYYARMSSEAKGALLKTMAARAPSEHTDRPGIR